MLLILGGVFQAIEALSAIVHDEVCVILRRYIYTFDLTAWGWIHLLIGLGLVAIGIFLLRGERWALTAGIVIAAISAVMNFTWLPHSPFWAMLLIAMNPWSSGRWPRPAGIRTQSGSDTSGEFLDRQADRGVGTPWPHRGGVRVRNWTTIRNRIPSTRSSGPGLRRRGVQPATMSGSNRTDQIAADGNWK